MKVKQDELEIEKAKEALLKKQRPLEVSSYIWALTFRFKLLCFKRN